MKWLLGILVILAVALGVFYLLVALPRQLEYPGSSHNDLIMAVSRPFRTRLPVLDESSAFLLEHSRD